MSRYRNQDNLLGQANSFMEVLEQVSQIAPLNKPVLIIGERGTGKELIAARLHYLSKRWDQTYLKLNCAALNESLLESELFGYEAGAFTGASKRREGRFETANNGTLFLDELGNTSGLIQEKLLRVIEYGEFERVGGSRSVKVDVRIVAATNEDLPTLADSGEFRADLLDRLAFDVITIPPLRERQEDILDLAENFAINMTRELELELFSGFSSKAEKILLGYEWPGNVRELKNVVERAVYRHNNPHVPVHEIILNPFDSPFRPKSRTKTNDKTHNQQLKPEILDSFSEPSDDIIKSEESINTESTTPNEKRRFPINLKEASQDFEKQLINDALAECQFNQKRTANYLGLTYHQLRGYLKKYNVFDGSSVSSEDKTA